MTVFGDTFTYNALTPIRLDTRSSHPTPPEPMDVEDRLDAKATLHRHRRAPVEVRMVNGVRRTHWVCAVCREDLGWQ